MKFKLRTGKYVHSDGTVHQPGAVVETDEDLVKKFGHQKFTLVDSNPVEQVPEPDTDGEDDE